MLKNGSNTAKKQNKTVINLDDELDTELDLRTLCLRMLKHHEIIKYALEFEHEIFCEKAYDIYPISLIGLATNKIKADKWIKKLDSFLYENDENSPVFRVDFRRVLDEGFPYLVDCETLESIPIPEELFLISEGDFKEYLETVKKHLLKINEASYEVFKDRVRTKSLMCVIEEAEQAVKNLTLPTLDDIRILKIFKVPSLKENMSEKQLMNFVGQLNTLYTERANARLPFLHKLYKHDLNFGHRGDLNNVASQPSIIAGVITPFGGWNNYDVRAFCEKWADRPEEYEEDNRGGYLVCTIEQDSYFAKITIKDSTYSGIEGDTALLVEKKAIYESDENFIKFLKKEKKRILGHLACARTSYEYFLSTKDLGKNVFEKNQKALREHVIE